MRRTQQQTRVTTFSDNHPHPSMSKSYIILCAQIRTFWNYHQYQNWKMVLNIHELWPLCGLRGTVLVLSEKQEQHVLKSSNIFSITPNTCHSHSHSHSHSQCVMTRVTCGQCHAWRCVWTVVWFRVNVEFLLQGFSTINQTSLLRICTVSLYDCTPPYTNTQHTLLKFSNNCSITPYCPISCPQCCTQSVHLRTKLPPLPIPRAQPQTPPLFCSTPPYTAIHLLTPAFTQCSFCMNS